MTTIATDGKTIASDSQQSGEFISQIEAQKLFKVNGVIYGCSGVFAHFVQYVEWVSGGRNKEQKPDLKGAEFSVVFVFDGDVYWEDESLTPIKVGAPHAIGSGSQIAMGAMLAGASPKRAVEIASRLDPYTGGKIIAMRC